MMLGPLVNSAALAAGAVFGALLGPLVPRRIKEALPLTFGTIAMGIGVVLTNKVNTLPAVALAIVLGSLIGELLSLEYRLEQAIRQVQKRFEKKRKKDTGQEKPQVEGFVIKFVTLSVLFCASGTGIFGAAHEGMTGETNILFAKAILDMFTAIIFATELGYSVALIAIPQLLIQGTLYLSANQLIPLTTPAMLADFSASGGILMLATGLRICGIKSFPIVNMLPALLLAMPISAMWAHFFA